MAIELISEITQKNGQPFPLIDSNNIRGGLYTVDTYEEMLNIPTIRLKTGMLCYVVSENKYYKLGDDWEEAKFGGSSSSGDITGLGVQIYDLEMLDSMDELPDKYISIPNAETDLEGSTISREILQDGTYVDILFSAIRKLQSEVAKLRNSFRYGIYSYTGTDTAMSQTVGDYSENVDEEPLWAVEEDDLSLIVDCELNENTQLDPASNVNVTNSGTAVITGQVSFEDVTFQSVEDPKTFVYVTTSNLDSVTLVLADGSASKTLNLGDLYNGATVDTYNTLTILNRVEGENFIWVSITNAKNDNILAQGYLNGTTLQSSKNFIDESYQLDKVVLGQQTLTKLTVYSKYQDFSSDVVPTTISDESYKYSVAHLTIRSVKSYLILSEIKDQLPDNELIYVEGNKKLYIKTNGSLVAIGSNSGSTSDDENDNGMTETELIEKLEEMGVITNDNGHLELNDIASLTFINEDTNKSYKFQVDSDGLLYGREVGSDSDTIESRLTKNGIVLTENIRGVISQLLVGEHQVLTASTMNLAKDVGLYSDRVKIGAVYAPLASDVNFGCSHAYIELENTSQSDFNLTGCYLHLTQPADGVQQVYHLPLNGTIKAGSTYLIRGIKYTDDTIINVDSFDQEFYTNGHLMDLTIGSSDAVGIALTYGNANLPYNESLWSTIKEATLTAFNVTKTNCPNLYSASFIDAIYLNTMLKDSGGVGYWASSPFTVKSNSITKNTFELDPAKLAFQSLNKLDSSRNRWANNGNDVQNLILNDSKISFPHTEETYDITKYTPKASYENKNVSSDKTQLDKVKPNMVTCSFGIDIYKTRCFNWVSAGLYNEYVWYKANGSDDWTRVESYNGSVPTGAKDLGLSDDDRAAIYDRITKTFPGAEIKYTAHKCIIDIVNEAVSSPVTYTYVVGRTGVDGNPDPDHSSEEMTFTLYPTSYKPQIYQITDQQGFHWIEYQAWAAAAKKINEKIEQDKAASNIIPILINTGDMTQNGTRINEWLDYYNAGKVLFDHLEQMNVVGNNDLCGIDPEILGTGDDNGKSNSFYFHVFYCYEVDPTNVPVVNGKYIPSLYYFDSTDYRIVMVNSELTPTVCANWYNLVDSNSETINIYTGFTIGKLTYNSGFTTIYTMLYNMLNITDKYKITVCHEMPFTVITQANLVDSSNIKATSRSISSGNLVGSHLNQISSNDTNKGIYWFSRLLELMNVRLCLGGHKHTYASTYPLREYFFWDNNSKNSLDNFGEYTMESTLENDDVTWVVDNINYTKFPLTKVNDTLPEGSSYFYPFTSVPDLEGGVVYFMLLASGYKLTSNKELPSANLRFSQFIPLTSGTAGNVPHNAQKYPMFARIVLSENADIQLMRVANILKNYSFNQSNYGTDEMTLQYLTSYDKKDDNRDVNIINDNVSEEDKMSEESSERYGRWYSVEKELQTVALAK